MKGSEEASASKNIAVCNTHTSEVSQCISRDTHKDKGVLIKKIPKTKEGTSHTKEVRPKVYQEIGEISKYINNKPLKEVISNQEAIARVYLRTGNFRQNL